MNEISRQIFEEIRPLLVEVVADALAAAEQRERKVFPETLSIDEVCEMTKYSKSAIYQLHWAGKAPFLRKLGNKLVASRDEVQAWMLAGGHKGRVNKKS